MEVSINDELVGFSPEERVFRLDLEKPVLDTFHRPRTARLSWVENSEASILTIMR